MAEIRNTASMRLRGRVGNTTYYVEGGRQIARVSQNSSNYGETARRTESQQSQRAKWANLVNFYKVSKAWMSKAFENKKRTQSDYNRFMQLNLAVASVYLTRDMYAAGGCVVEPYKVTEGSLRSIVVERTEGVYKTDIKLGSLEISETTSVGAFTQAVLANNAHMREGMQISFISYQQDINANNVPQLICTAYEVTLQLSNNLALRDFLPYFCSSVQDGCLSTDGNISTGCFAYILSDSTSGRTLVSTQTLISNNATLIAQYSTPAAVAASIASYGVEEDVFLMSGSRAQEPAAGTQYVAAVRKINGVKLWPVNGQGEFIGEIADASSNRFRVVMASDVAAASSDISVTIKCRKSILDGESEFETVVRQVASNEIEISLSNEAFAYQLTGAVVTIAGNTYVGNWLLSNTEHV